MSLKYIFKIAIGNIMSHKSRSSLTALGIIIGVTSIIIIMSIGNGAKDLIVREITSLGADIIWIEPGREPSGPSDIASAIFSKTLKDRDIAALRKKTNVPGIKEIAPAVVVPGAVAYRGETYRPLIMGFSAEFMGSVFNIYPDEGVYFDDIAIKNRERVAVIGDKVRRELFGESDAVGEIIKINNKSFKVVGVLTEKGQVLFFNIGEVVLIPPSTAQTYLLGTDFYNEVWVRVEDVDTIPSIVRDIEFTLREMHNITDPEKDDFYILTQESLLDQVESIINILTITIASIVAIALVVGGVGVMNIMLVSVTERTREIGLRKAVGATERDIVLQFLFEASILAFAGGVLGVILGTAISYIVMLVFAQVTGITLSFVFPFFAIGLGVFVSTAVGLIFGIYPAREASLKNPIEALRYE